MAIELLFNLILLIFFGYCLINVSFLTNIPGSDPMGAALWPQLILSLLIIFLAINIKKIHANNKKNPDKVEKIDFAEITSFFKSKLFLGILITVIMSILMNPIGFFPSTYLFLVAYMILLGQRNPIKILLFSLIITVLLFFLFSKGLSIMLPRGIGIFREFHLLLESI